MQNESTAQSSPKASPRQSESVRKRFILLDELRGLTLISMILYHFMWDLAYIVGLSMPWYRSVGAHIWQQSICWTFILLSGFCWSLGHHPFRRGMIVFFCGMTVTAVTLVLGEAYTILFGVLTLIGSSMLLMIPLDFVLNRLLCKLSSISLKKVLLSLLTAICFVLFWQSKHHGDILPADFPRNLFTAYLGFPFGGFYSTDYFPIVPWFFLYITGYLLHKLWQAFDTPGSVCAHIDDFACASHIPLLSFLGRHCLLLYMLHQPVLYVISMIISMFLTQ
ncbi:MAG: DUF1624 domain-containing protein [Lachnospiraceae bacterium]|nr:DUF1624 domain-containing protein [Lachnospiraceae bacterium]